MWKLITQTSATRIYGLLVGVIFLSLTARWFGPEGRGQLAAVLTWVGAFSTFGYLSLGQVAIREAAIDRDGAWLRDAFGTLIFWTCVATIVGLFLALFLYQSTDGKIFGGLPGWLLILGFTLLPFQIWEKHGSSLLMALERLDIYNRYQIIGKSLSLAVLLVLVIWVGLGVEGAIIATTAGQAILAIGGFFLVWRTTGRPHLFNSVVNLKYAKKGMYLHLSAIGTYVFAASDVLMLNYYHGAEMTGYYQLGTQLTAIILVVPQAASMVLYGKVASEGPDVAWRYQRKILFQIIGLIIIGALIAGFTVQWWLLWFAGDEFSPAIDVFRWQLLSVVGMSFSILMGSQWIGRGYFWQVSLITVFVALGNIIANTILIPEYGMYGAIWATLGVYMFSIFANGWMAIHCQHETIRAGN